MKNTNLNSSKNINDNVKIKSNNYVDSFSTKSNKKEFTLNKSRSIEKRDKTPLGKNGRNNISNISLNQTSNNSNSKRKKSKTDNVVKKLESEIEKDTANFSNLSLEKRWRLIN